MAPDVTPARIVNHSPNSVSAGGIRFRAYGKRWVIKLGRLEDGWTTQMAERELAVVLRDVDLGTWRPPRPEPAPEKEVDPTFHEFASDWYATKELEVEPNTANHYRNDLTNHLLPFFKQHHLSQITVAEVDRYRQHKVRQAAEITAAAESGKPMMVSYVDRLGRRYRRRARPLSARSINMHIDLLAQILAVAVDHGHLPSNPAVGKRRRMKVSKPRPVHLDSAEQIAILLEAAGQLDRGEAVIDVTDRRGRTWTQRHPSYTTGRRAALATLLLGGGRASATGAMLWRDVDLANGRFEVGRDKTDAGMREVDMLPLLREILTEHKAASERTRPNDPVFVTSTGTARSRHNLRQDVVDAGGRPRASARRRARPAAPAARHHPAQAATHLRLDPRRDRQGPDLRHAAARPHRPGVHAAGLRAHDAPQRRGARAAQGARRRPGFGRE